MFAVSERKLIAKVSVTNNLRQRKIVRGNQAFNCIRLKSCWTILTVEHVFFLMRGPHAGSFKRIIMKTCPCNIQRFFKL